MRATPRCTLEEVTRGTTSAVNTLHTMTSTSAVPRTKASGRATVSTGVILPDAARAPSGPLRAASGAGGGLAQAPPRQAA